MALVQRFLAVVEGSPAQQQEHDWKMQETRNASLLDKKGKQHDFKFCLWVLLTDRQAVACAKMQNGGSLLATSVVSI